MTAADRAAEAALAQMFQHTQDWLEANEGVGVCDFCAHPLVPGEATTWIIDSPIVATLSGLTADLGAASGDLVYDELWGACPACDPVIEAGDPVALAEQAISHRDRGRVEISEATMEATRDDLVDLYRAFYARNPRREETS